jgi:hypothetical protein
MTIILLSAFNFDGWLPGCLSPGHKQKSSARPFSAEQTSKSAPNVERCALEQDIGMELRAISDCFHLECAGFVSRLLNNFRSLFEAQYCCDIICLSGIMSHKCTMPTRFEISRYLGDTLGHC